MKYISATHTRTLFEHQLQQLDSVFDWYGILNLIIECWSGTCNVGVEPGGVVTLTLYGGDGDRMITALQQTTFWETCWQQSRRGGYY